jgi:hypothetical protein
MSNLYGFDLRSCDGCKHFESGGYDRDTGYDEPTACAKAQMLAVNGECAQEVANMFEAILFQLSCLNNCPLREVARPSIVDRKASA